MKGLSRDREARFRTALDMARALEEVIKPASSAEIAEWLGRVVPSVLDERRALALRASDPHRSDIRALAVPGSVPPPLSVIPPAPALPTLGNRPEVATEIADVTRLTPAPHRAHPKEATRKFGASPRSAPGRVLALPGALTAAYARATTGSSG